MKPAAAKLMIAAATISAFGSASALATDGNCTYHGI